MPTDLNKVHVYIGIVASHTEILAMITYMTPPPPTLSNWVCHIKRWASIQAILSDAFQFTFNFTPVLTEMLKGLFKELPIDNEPGTESVNIFPDFLETFCC